MRSKNLDSSAKEVIESMFQVLFSDLSSGMSEAEAGWRYLKKIGIEQTQHRGLLSSGVIEGNSRGEVRLNFKNYRTLQQLKETFELESKQLEYFLNAKTDEMKLDKAQKTLNGIVQIVQESPESWKYIVALGWWRMLESSGMPALIDGVLNEGISPKDWTIKAIKCSSELALSVAQKLGEINEFKEATNFLRQIKMPVDNIGLLPPVEEDDVQRVKKILKWVDIEKEVTEPIMKTLGFWWFLFLVFDSANLFPLSGECIVKLYKALWDGIEKLAGKSQSELLNELGNMMSIFEVNQITWASDIIRIPEAM